MYKNVFQTPIRGASSWFFGSLVYLKYLNTKIRIHFLISYFFKMDVDTAIMLYALIIKKRNKKIKKQRLLWEHPIVSQRYEKGHFQNLFPDLLQYPSKFFNYFRMSRNSFFELHDAIKYDIRKEDTNMRKSITTEERLAVH